MSEREIAELSAWTAKAIADTIKEEGRAIDDAGEDIIREYVRTCLLNWQRLGQASREDCAELVTKIFNRRRHETTTELETFNALMIFGAKFPSFAANHQRKRDEEAARIAAEMPAVKA